jgi:hypothetical protein
MFRLRRGNDGDEDFPLFSTSSTCNLQDQVPLRCDELSMRER